MVVRAERSQNGVRAKVREINSPRHSSYSIRIDSRWMGVIRVPPLPSSSQSAPSLYFPAFFFFFSYYYYYEVCVLPLAHLLGAGPAGPTVPRCADDSSLAVIWPCICTRAVFRFAYIAGYIPVSPGPESIAPAPFDRGLSGDEFLVHISVQLLPASVDREACPKPDTHDARSTHMEACNLTTWAHNRRWGGEDSEPPTDWQWTGTGVAYIYCTRNRWRKPSRFGRNESGDANGCWGGESRHLLHT